MTQVTGTSLDTGSLAYDATNNVYKVAILNDYVESTETFIISAKSPTGITYTSA
jgi:hypothetical protein